MFAQLPGLIHCHTRAPSLSPCPEGFLQESELNKDQNWAPNSLGVPGSVQNLLTPNTRYRVCHRYLFHPTGNQLALRHHKQKTSCRGSLQTASGENQANLRQQGKGRRIKVPNANFSLSFREMAHSTFEYTFPFFSFTLHQVPSSKTPGELWAEHTANHTKLITHL